MVIQDRVIMSSAVHFRGGHPVPSPCLHACSRRSRVSLEPGHSCGARDSACFHRRAFYRPLPPESCCRLEQPTSVNSRIEAAWGDTQSSISARNVTARRRSVTARRLLRRGLAVTGCGGVRQSVYNEVRNLPVRQPS